MPVVQLVNGNLLNILDPNEKTVALIEKKDSKKLKLMPGEQKDVIRAKKEAKEERYQSKLEKVRSYRNSLGVKLKIKKAKAPNPKSVKKGVGKSGGADGDKN